MAKIISISLNGEILEQLDFLQKQKGFSGRSEIIRTAIRNLIELEKNSSNCSGKINAVLIVTHKNLAADKVSDKRHEFKDVVKTHVHEHLGGKCVEIFALSGTAQKINLLTNFFKTNKKTISVQLAVI